MSSVRSLRITQKSYRRIAPKQVFRSEERDYAQAMQRLFSMFPQGAPGIALLLLRFLVAAMFSISLIKGTGLASSYLVLLPLLGISAMMATGLLTPIVSFLVCASAAAILVIQLQWHNLILVSIIINAAALGLLGPGAYSLDARLFGRRVMVLPKDSPRD